MEIRQATNPVEAKHYTTDRLRKEYLIQNILIADQANYVYTHHDRMIVGGAMPVTKEVVLENYDELKSEFFLERRELGIINVGGHGTAIVNGNEFSLDKLDCLYVGRGNRDVKFRSADKNNPAKYFLISTPAHAVHPTRKLTKEEATPQALGAIETANERTIYKYIHLDGIKSCQLVMGLTVLKTGSIWNTMPSHTHDRRMEVYFYYDMAENTRIMHFMGEPTETRHLVVKNDEAIISPPWSIHSGAGTSNYSFIWAMAGENQSFTDMDFVEMKDLR